MNANTKKKLMIENKWLNATIHLLTQSEIWKDVECSVNFRASVAILIAAILIF